jgi:hypothetical protein
MPRSRRRLAALCLLTLLAAHASWGRTLSRRTTPKPSGPVDRLVALVSGYLGLNSAWLKEGCMLDPFGRCASKANPASGDVGCMLDPFGRCSQAAPNSDEGCMVDPDGRCAMGQ